MLLVEPNRFRDNLRPAVKCMPLALSSAWKFTKKERERYEIMNEAIYIFRVSTLPNQVPQRQFQGIYSYLLRNHFCQSFHQL